MESIKMGLSSICMVLGGLVLVAGFIASVMYAPPAVPIGIVAVVIGFGIGYKVGKGDVPAQRPAAEPARAW